jgi:anti-anti-sigma factor
MGELRAELPDEPTLAVAVRRVGARAVVDVAGDIDLATGPVLADAIGNVIDDGAFEVWVDLTRTAFMDSTGIHLLLDVRRRLDELDRRLAIICPGDEIRTTFAVTGVDRMLPLYSAKPSTW